MRLSDFLGDVGPMVGYSPRIARVLGGAKQGLLLCQFFYWSERTDDEDGWFYKTAEEIEEETGLTYREQHTARAHLVELGIIEERRKRIEHKMFFRVNRAALDALWERRAPELGFSKRRPLKPSLPSDENASVQQREPSLPNDENAVREPTKAQLARGTEITSESTTENKNARVHAAANFLQSPLFPVLLEATGKATDYDMGHCTPKFIQSVGRLIAKLEHDGKTIDDIQRYCANLPAFLNKLPGDVTPPQPDQMLDNFDRVLAHKPRSANHGSSTNRNGRISTSDLLRKTVESGYEPGT